jgi:hypothetical protein
MCVPFVASSHTCSIYGLLQHMICSRKFQYAYHMCNHVCMTVFSLQNMPHSWVLHSCIRNDDYHILSRALIYMLYLMSAVFLHVYDVTHTIYTNSIALFIYLQRTNNISGVALVCYCVVVSIGLTLTIYRLYMVWWAKFRLKVSSV